MSLLVKLAQDLFKKGPRVGAMDVLARHSDAGVPVLHWFSGTKAELQRAVAMGCWFSVGPAMVTM